MSPIHSSWVPLAERSALMNGIASASTVPSTPMMSTAMVRTPRANQRLLIASLR